MRTFIFDPRIFNFVIMALYTMNACRWAFEGKWADVSYWEFVKGRWQEIRREDGASQT